eukprot:TRINITY_DN33592_c0_g1_i1.p1 TRINITY_DN33592_c0_g1~~TRINITY_DN33592_c0_g1_i1.p1  ORF type:complete len:352 (-),score=85.46 TRINITY_DN33592_c0_g1_i1:500-1555(-)
MLMWIVGLGGRLLVCQLLLWIVILLLPNGIVSKFKVLRRSRAFALWLKKVVITEGAFSVVVDIGKRALGGKASSPPCAPLSLRATATGAAEATVSFAPQLPSSNPFHEEHYICAYRELDGSAEGTQNWTEVKLQEEDFAAMRASSGRLKAFLEKLPRQARLSVRACAANARGRSDWSSEVAVDLLAEPEDGGFIGPLGLAARTLETARRHYRWSQKRGEVSVKIPLAKDWPGREIQFKVTASRIEVLHAPRPAKAAGDASATEVAHTPEQVLLAGPFPKKVKVDEVFWDIDETEKDGRHIAVTMRKFQDMEKWDCLIDAEGHRKIDARLVRIYTKAMDGLGKGGIDIFEDE